MAIMTSCPARASNVTKMFEEKSPHNSTAGQELGIHFEDGDPVNMRMKGPTCVDPKVPESLPFCLPADYEKSMRPPDLKYATRIEIETRVEEIEKISDTNNTMTLMVHLRIKWKDPRINITNRGPAWQSAKAISRDIVDTYFWVPDVTVYNLKSLKMAKVIHPTSLVRLHENKTVEYTFGVKVTVGCNFTFYDYPFDYQYCKLLLGSYSYTQDHMYFVSSYVAERQNIRPLQYLMKFTSLDKHELTFKSYTAESGEGGEFSVCGLKVLLQRISNGYILRTFVPAALVVCVSHVSFLVSQKEVVGRLTLLVTLTLIEVNIL